MDELISVIIPVYRVEAYIRRCIESVLCQTYKNLEIILVDDGSPDRCGEICDSYSASDKRIQVIHKKNGGLSDARNCGLDRASGTYVTFLDSDDWLHREYVEKLYLALEKTDSDIAACDYLETWTGNMPDQSSDCGLFEYSSLEFLDLLRGERNVHVVLANCKLYKKQLFSDIRYPYGRIHEDEFTTYKLVYRATKIAVLGDKLYFYRQRALSITSSGFSVKRSIDKLDAFQERADFFMHSGLCELAAYSVRAVFVSFMESASQSREFRTSVTSERRDKIKENLRRSNQRAIVRTFCKFYFRAPRLMTGVYKISKRKKRTRNGSANQGKARSVARQMSLNMLTQTAGFFVNILVYFFLTPYIINRVGSISYGFVSLSNNFATYAEFTTIALNSMAARFITIKIHQHSAKDASRYFTSVLYSNIFIAVALTVPIALLTLHLDSIIDVSGVKLIEIKALFALSLLNFLIGIVTSAFSIATFSRNELYRSSFHSMIGNLLKILVLVILFSTLGPHIWILSISAIAVTLYLFIWNRSFTKKLLPEISIEKKFFSFSAVREIVCSGVWNLVIRLSQILTEGLDLLIANLVIGLGDMSLLAVAKTVANLVIYFITSIGNIFNPQLTILYARNNAEELIKSTKFFMNIMSVIAAVPNAILLVFGASFIKLWVPDLDAMKVYTLSVMISVTICVTAPLQPIYQIIVITNRVKTSASVMMIYGACSVGVTLLLLYTTPLGIYAVAGVSSVLGIIVALLFHVPYGARCLGLNWSKFYPEVFKSVMAYALLILAGFFIRLIVPSDSWVGLIVCGILTGISGLAMNIYTVLSKDQRHSIWLLLKGLLSGRALQS